MVLTFRVSVRFDALRADGTLAVAFLPRDVGQHEKADAFEEHTILRFRQQRQALPRCKGLGFMMDKGWETQGRQGAEEDRGG